jgi:hypothetical protein
VHLALTQLAAEHIKIHIEMDELEFPTSELKEHVNVQGHLNIVVLRMLIQILQDLQIHLLQEIISEEMKHITS